jgi:outer membrane lipopolysaccharide assembly protein LptE/RlpB
VSSTPAPSLLRPGGGGRPRAPRGVPRPAGRPALLLAVAALALLAAGCGVYSTKPGLLPSHIKRIAIPTFENRTTEAGLDQEVTEAIVTRFVADNHLKVVSERQADAVLSGAVTDYRNVVFGFTGQVQAQEYRVSLTLAVRLLDKVKNREIWRDDALMRNHNYYVVPVPGQPAEDERTGRQEAIQKLADEILSRTIENW